MKQWARILKRWLGTTRCVKNALCVFMLVLTCGPTVRAQDTATPAQGVAQAAESRSNLDLQQRVDQLEAEVTELKEMVKQLRATAVSNAAPVMQTGPAAATGSHHLSPTTATDPQDSPAGSGQSLVTADDRKALDFLRDTTINVGLDGYYAYNFNHPVGRVNLLRAYDVLSNNFSLNQASVIFEHAPDVAAGRRFGARVDLQFGQATDTLQGNPSNEPRPQIYRNIFQAYGTYVFPFSKGLTVDFGKWASPLGIEGNYTKDQMNYSRSYYFDFLPFYHMGARVVYKLNNELALNYWVVNGTNQTEDVNGSKDQMFGFTATPRKTISWTFNYHMGQEHPDRVVVPPTSPIPVQPGLSFQATRPAPDGRTHIFDSYVTWQATPKLTLALEGDYVIQRLWKDAGPGRSSAPSRVDGGVAYARYQLTPRVALATRAEYLSDRGGLFSGITQALKENTLTFDYKVADGFLMRYEWRRDFSNQPSFLTDTQGVLGKQQNTATLGLIWWWGRKEGSW
jgi:hypothetical protein